MEEEQTRIDVRKGYAKIAKEGLNSSCANPCCGSLTHEELSKKIKEIGNQV